MLAQPTAHLATLYEISQIINSTLDLNEVLDLVMSQVTTVTGAERGFLMLRNNEDGQIVGDAPAADDITLVVIRRN